MILPKISLVFCITLSITQLKAMQNPTQNPITLKNQTIILSDQQSSKISQPLVIEGKVIVEGKGQHLTLENTCLIKKGAKFIIAHGVMLKIAPTDGNRRPIQFEDNTGSIIFKNAILQIKNLDETCLENGSFEFYEQCCLDVSKKILFINVNACFFSLLPNSSLEVVSGQIDYVK